MANRRAKLLRRLRLLIPDDFPCEPGCADCCKNHTWTWLEWESVEPKLLAAYQGQACPYVLPNGCACYEDRPIICRLFGHAGPVEVFGRIIDFSCPRGIMPITRIDPKDVKDLFKKWMTIIHDEARDQANAGKTPVFAGPYGAFVPTRRA